MGTTVGGIGIFVGVRSGVFIGLESVLGFYKVFVQSQFFELLEVVTFYLRIRP